MISTENGCIQAISSVIEKGANAKCRNGIAVFFLCWIRFQLIDVILTLNIKILALIRIKRRNVEVQIGFFVRFKFQGSSSHGCLELRCFFSIVIDHEAICFVCCSEIRFRRLWTESIRIRREMSK